MPSLNFFFNLYMKTYELMMIIDPKLESTSLKTLLSDIWEDFGVCGIKVQKEDVWGVRDLAYQINGSSQGYYVLYNFSVENPEKLQWLEKALNLKKSIWRHLISLTPQK